MAACFPKRGCASVLFLPKAARGGFNNTSNMAMLGHAVGFLAIAAAFQLFDGLQAVLAGALRGLQDTRVPMQLALIGYWLGGFATSVALGFFTPLAGTGVWLGLAVGLVIVSLLLGWRWTQRERLGLLPH